MDELKIISEALTPNVLFSSMEDFGYLLEMLNLLTSVLAITGTKGRSVDDFVLETSSTTSSVPSSPVGNTVLHVDDSPKATKDEGREEKESKLKGAGLKHSAASDEDFQKRFKRAEASTLKRSRNMSTVVSETMAKSQDATSHSLVCTFISVAD